MSSFASPALQESYASRGYAYVEGLVPAIVLQRFHERMRRVLDFQNAPQFHTQSWLATKPTIEVYSMQYPPMAAFHWGLTPVAAQIAGCDVLPTYAYFRVYQKDDICVVHSDRDACEHSMSLMVELADHAPWALCIGSEEIGTSRDPQRDFGGEKYTALPMRSGDAVMYRGVTRRHGRVDPNPNRWSAHLFLHWVDSSGPFADQAFDRPALERAGVKI